MADDTLLRVALAAAEARDPTTVLSTVVGGLTAGAGLALARVWLVRPGEPCEVCPMREECPDQKRCLHLAASAGNPRHEPQERWSRTDGDFRRFPLGVRKVGHIAATGESLLVARRFSGLSARRGQMLASSGHGVTGETSKS